MKITNKETVNIFAFCKVEDFKKEVLSNKCIIHVINRQYPVLVEQIDLRPMEYKLFLSRVIESINRDHVGGFKIITTDYDLIVQEYITGEIEKIVTFNKQIDSARESVIRYVLESL